MRQPRFVWFVLAVAVSILAPVVVIAQPSPTPAATPVSPYAIPVGKDIGYRVEISQTFGAQWWFTGSLVFQVDPSGKITGGYLGDSDQQNPSYPTDPMLGRENPVSGSITPANKIQLVIGSGSLQWTIQGTAAAREINGTMSSGRFGLMTFYATRVHIPKHPANIQKPT